MKVLVMGATGMTGQHAVRMLLARGDEVTAFARTPSAIAPQPKLRVVQGEARDLGSLERAGAAQDAVLSAFGPRSLKKDDVQEVFMRNLISAMKKAGVRRLVNLSAWGAGDSYERGPLMMKLLRNTLLRNMYDDKERGETLLLASGLDFVNVRPGRLMNSPARGGVKAALEGKGLAPKLTREDLAAFMVSQLASDAWVGKSPLVGY
jgi:uncharacterized protein YbjT (DUF2867 family)